MLTLKYFHWYNFFLLRIKFKYYLTIKRGNSEKYIKDPLNIL